ncbi:MAG: hypothetical protein O7G87_18365 [bacterium]|nr:hypothetical protein [bacterium]
MSQIAQLDGDQLSKVQELEQKLDINLIALESQADLKDLSLGPQVELADLSSEAIQAVQALEQEIGTVVLAYQQTT